MRRPFYNLAPGALRRQRIAGDGPEVIPARVQFHRDGDGVPTLTFYQNLLAIKAVGE